MHVELVAFESMGVRAQATFVQVHSANIFIDPSAALAPRRFGLPPHVFEARRLLEIFDRIEELVRDSNMIVVTHYHYDHHDPGRFMDPEVYRGKVVYVKDPKNNINTSQRIRASTFLKIVSGRAREIHVAEGRSVELEGTCIRFSHPLPHGEEGRLGYVSSACIESKDAGILYTSDVEGGPTQSHRFLLNFCSGANVAIVDGPPTYLLGYRYSEASFRNSLEFLADLLGLESLEIIVLDHHICREFDYINKIEDILSEASKKGKKLVTAAQFMGSEPMFLEARRRELFAREPVDGLNTLMSRYRVSSDSVQPLGEDL